MASVQAMKRLATVALLCAAGGAPALAQGPAAVREYQRGINVEHYSVTVVIPDSGRRVAVTSVAYVRRTAAVDTLRLDLLGAMRVRRVTANGSEVTFARDSQSVRVALPRWNRAECANPRPSTVDRPDPCLDWVSVDAVGEPADGLIISQDPRGRWQYFADHWPNRARNWLPLVDHPSDKATIEWRVHAPTVMKVVANGRLREESPLPSEAGRSITVWQTERPIPAYLMVIGVAQMARIDLGPTACGLTEFGACVSQDVYESPELAPRTPPGFAAAEAIVEWLARRIGPFPYERLSHVQSSTRFGGMENAGTIFYSDQAFRNMTLGEGLVAHETAHQWFGDAATPARWADLWLSEGFATYFAALWEHEARGDTAFRSAMSGIKQRIVTAQEVATRPVVDSLQTDLMALLNRNSYQKGGYVLHMLRQEVGDSTWWKGIRAYYDAHRHANATTDDLMRAMETASGTDLRWFFDQWLRRPGYAELTAQWEQQPNRAVRLTIAQGTRFAPYRLHVPVAFELETGVVVRQVVTVNAARSTVITLPAATFPAAVRRVTLDPDGDLLALISSR